MKKNYLLMILCIILLVCACTEENTDYSIENKRVIEYLKKEYNVDVLSSSIIITDSVLSEIENYLQEEIKLITEFNNRSKAIADSIKNIYNSDLKVMEGDPYPIRYPVLETSRAIIYHRIHVLSLWGDDINPKISVDEETLVPTLGQWRFNYINIFTEPAFKELSFRISAYCFVVVAGVSMGTHYQFDGEANHYQGWIWMDWKML